MDERNAKNTGSARPTETQDNFAVRAPAISLPKGGGAIRGIGEKFAANPVTGSGTFSVPIATSPGRAGFGPELQLNYDSGSGNGPFGFGWSLSAPSITRKTEKGLPQYNDAADSDVFILSGAEDLVPVLRQHSGQIAIHDEETGGFRVRRYRPRIEGLFAKIERWTNIQDPTNVHWRSISRTNVLTLYGFDSNSRIADPLDSRRIFSWLLSETRDDKGNTVVYRYKSEDELGVNLFSAHERNRDPDNKGIRKANRYLKRILYGNEASLLDPTTGQRPRFLIPEKVTDAKWMFEVVFDYGDHDQSVPTPSDDTAKKPDGSLKYPWKVRADAFSSYRATFEVRTYRTCRRVLMFHHFPGEAGVERDCLVRSTDFEYSADVNPADARNPVYSFLKSVRQIGYRRNGTKYDQRSLPPVEFEYSEPKVQDKVEDVPPESLENLPIGVDGRAYRWTDLHGEGIPGVLTEQSGAWHYKRNLSPITNAVQFAPVETVALKPNVSLAEGADIMDLAGDGLPDVVIMSGATPGLFEHDEAEGWQPFRPFISRLNRSFNDPNLKFVDLNGDGHADVLITEQDAIVWHESLAEQGFGSARPVIHERDEEEGPRVVFADRAESIHLADLSGDGLSDIIRVRNGDVCYWPNLGYGRFGAKVTMDNPPSFDDADQFDQKRIRLADIDGSGTTDIIYLHRNGVRIYFNQSGNSWSQENQLEAFARVDDVVSIMPTDLMGNGTACLVWSSALPGDSGLPLRYVNLMGSQKPHLLIKTTNNLGATTEVRYAPSTKFYLQDKRDGKPWITRLPFPVHVVESVIVADKWRGTTFSTSYSYHHGYFDGVEREFRGFGRVEQVDTEDYGKFAKGNADSPYVTSDQELFQPPVKSVTWFHTGAFVDQRRIHTLFAEEYFPQWFERLNPVTTDVVGGFRENPLPEPDFADLHLTPEEWREALRACNGLLLRQEVYELDVDFLREGIHKPVKLFSTAYHNCHIDRLQERGENQHAVFLVTESEAITYHYELDLRSAPVKPDARVSHSLNLQIDGFGNVLQSVAVGYPRFHRFEDPDLLFPLPTVDPIREVQSELHIAYIETRFTKDIDGQDDFRLRVPCEVLTYELTGVAPKPASSRYFRIGDLREHRLSDVHQTDGSPVAGLAYHEWPDRGSSPPQPQKRLVEHARTLYLDDVDGSKAPTLPLPFGEHGPRGLKFEDYKLALTDDLLTAVFQDKLDRTILGTSERHKLETPITSGYLSGPALAERFKSTDTSGQFWVRSGVAGFALGAAKHFFLPERYTDPFGNVTEVTFDSRHLYIESTKDARWNEVRITQFDFRVLAPSAMQDANGNATRAAFDILGMPVAVALEAAGDAVPDASAAALDPSPSEIVAFMDAQPYEETAPRSWLDRATSRFVYSFGETVDGSGKVVGWEARPAAACAIQRETHAAPTTKIQVAIEYSDGGGNVLVKKAQAEPDPDKPAANPKLRWIASGKTVLNNKGKPVKQYEPYFSETEHRFDPAEAAIETGVTPIMYYDSAGRVVRTEMPDGTFSRVEFSPWHVATFDANDTVLESRWYRERLTLQERGAQGVADAAEEAKAAVASDDDKRAASLAALHHNTPARTLLDSLGREVIAVAHNREPSQDPTYDHLPLKDRPWVDQLYTTHTKLDAEGKPLWIRDARGNLVMQYIVPHKANNDPSDDVPSRLDTAGGKRIFSAPCYDIAGNLLFQHSMDAGDRWMLTDAAGKPMLAWDENDRGPGTPMQTRLFHTEYDELHRPTKQWLKIDSGQAALIEAFDTCDTSQPNGAANLADAKQRNLIGQAVRHWDPSGLATVERIDLCGKPAHITRTLIKPVLEDLTGVTNWDVPIRNSLLETETFRQITEYDALGRMTRLYNWHRDMTFASNGTSQITPGATNRVAVYEPSYNERGALVSEWLHIRATKATAPNGRTTFSKDPQRSQQAITKITYNAKGQKLRLDLGNGTSTRYTYEADTFRLQHLYTRRSGDIAAGDCGRNTAEDARPQRPCGLQNLHYSYDPVGNIAHIQDDAQDSRFFANVFVEPSYDYTYDAIYRLIEATGRENAAAVAPPPNREGPWPRREFPSADALRRYTQRYLYDSVGNFIAMVHRPSSGTGWTRHYTTKADSNRLEKTWYGSNALEASTYRHDAHGCMLNLNRMAETPTLDSPEKWGLDIRWDWRDMIIGVDLGGGGLARYHYGIEKQRTRKYIRRRGNEVEDRAYLGGYELYRRYRNSSATSVEEIESQHLFEGEQRLLLVDDVTVPVGHHQEKLALLHSSLVSAVKRGILPRGRLLPLMTYGPVELRPGE